MTLATLRVSSFVLVIAGGCRDGTHGLMNTMPAQSQCYPHPGVGYSIPVFTLPRVNLTHIRGGGGGSPWISNSTRPCLVHSGMLSCLGTGALFPVSLADCSRCSAPAQRHHGEGWHLTAVLSVHLETRLPQPVPASLSLSGGQVPTRHPDGADTRSWKAVS